MEQTYHKPASLLPPSKNILLPRPQGDGMDSETLKKQDFSPQTIQSRSRHHNLASSPKTATFVKSPKQNYIPHEPVKGAVKPLVNENYFSKPQVPEYEAGKTQHVGPVNNGTSPSRSSSRDPAQNIGAKNVNAEGVSFNHRSSSSKEKNITKTIKVPVYNAPGHLNHNTYLMMQKQQMMVSNMMKPKPEKKVVKTIKDTVKIDMEYGNRPSNVAPQNVAINIDPTIESLREVEGDNRTASMADLEKLNDEIDELRRELENQTRVNADLKKLLVASMGDDLHYKVDRLVQDKAQLAEEVGHYSKKLNQDYEDIDKLSIQADLWRSKFKASKVMSEELMKNNSNLRQHFQSSHLALQRLLQERQQMKEWLSQTHRHLYKVKHAFDPRHAPRQTKSGPQTLLSLTQANLQLADNVKFRLLGPNTVLEDGVDSSTVDAISPAEAYAFQVLSTPAPTVHLTAGAQQTCAPPTVVPAIPYSLDEPHSRFHPDTKYDNLTIDVCCKCKGEIQVV